MAIYSQEQLYGAGTPIEVLSGGTCTFTFTSENTGESILQWKWQNGYLISLIMPHLKSQSI
jgi:hypothetical protein